MGKVILAMMIGGGIMFSVLAIIEVDERKKRSTWEKWESKLP